MSERDRRELESIEKDVLQAASLSDGDRIRILRDLLRTAAAIQSRKRPEEIRRESEVRRQLEDLPARARYASLSEKFE